MSMQTYKDNDGATINATPEEVAERVKIASFSILDDVCPNCRKWIDPSNALEHASEHEYNSR